MKLRTVMIAFIALGWLIPAAGQAANFPTGPITFIVPYPAGGATDIVCRPLADAARKVLGQPVIIENRGGGGGAVGVGSIVGKKPDGYLISAVVDSLHRNSFLNKLPFDTVKDVTPIMSFCGNLYGILVRPDSPYKTLKDLLDAGKASPGKLSYMASGMGTSGHIAMEELAFNAGNIKFSHIPSKGDAESSAALLGSHVDFISTSAGWIPLVEAGQLRLLATYSEKRTKRFPNVPTTQELGFKVVQTAPIGVLGPKGMPKEIVKALQDAFKKAMEDKIFIGACDKYEMPVKYMGSEEFAKYWAAAYVEAGEKVKKFIQQK
jgi:tripartite-type tricarboxylate transporter receptor subunit TctC